MSEVYHVFLRLHTLVKRGDVCYTCNIEKRQAEQAKGKGAMNFRDFVMQCRADGVLVEIAEPTSPHLELAQRIYQHDGAPILFSQVAGYEGWRVAAGIASARGLFARALNVAVGNLAHHLAEALDNPLAPQVVQTAPCQEVVEPVVNLHHLPILRHFPTDAGDYITSGLLLLDDPEYGPNVSFHRLLRLDERRLVARVVEQRGTHRAWQQADNDVDVPVAICIGNSLPMLLAGSMSPALDVDEMAVANVLAPTPVVRGTTVPIYVPAESEIVLEGRLTHTTTDEGPFVDLTETMDIVRQQPVIEIDAITHRRNPIYQALLPGKLEHKLLMGMPREPTILASVRRVCRCTGVAITAGGTSWLHAVVQIEPRHPDDARKAIDAAFAGHGSLKHVVVVDTDVNIFNPTDVEWAIPTRFQASRDLVVLHDQPGSSLDPSGTHVPGQKARTAKMGLDATIPWGADRAAFERVPFVLQ